MFTGYRREEDRVILYYSPDREDFQGGPAWSREGSRKQHDHLVSGVYEIVVPNDEIEAYREDLARMACSPMLAAVQRGESDVKVASDIALHKMIALNHYRAERIDEEPQGVRLVQSDAEAQAKFVQSLREGREAAFDAIRAQQLGEQWYERIRERVSDPPTRRLPEPTYSESGLVYD